MHKIQQDLLELSKTKNLAQYTLREIAKEIKAPELPQLIKHHLNQLEKKGLIQVDKIKGVIGRTKQHWVKGFLRKARLLAIPILGAASAGPATATAKEDLQGYLRVSQTLVGSNASNRLFALKVSGPSMNRVEFDGKTIQDGDFVIINRDALNPHDGEVVLSIIDGAANIKKFYRDRENNQIVLMSDSTGNFPPIYIDETDDYQINGKVVQVIKKPKINA